jgi:hypothetical protein
MRLPISPPTHAQHSKVFRGLQPFKNSYHKYVYYKIQYFNDVVLSWKDIQKSYPSLNEGVVAVQKSKYKKRRLMCVDGKKRYPVMTIEAQPAS